MMALLMFLGLLALILINVPIAVALGSVAMAAMSSVQVAALSAAQSWALDTVDLAVLFRFNRPSGSEEKLLSVAHTYLVSAPGDPLTLAPTVDFSRLADLRHVERDGARGAGRACGGRGWRRRRGFGPGA